MVENIYNNASGDLADYQTEGRKAPKNVRQIGYFTSNFRVYIEDYVHTFTRWLAEQDYSGRCVAVLVGEFAKSEHTRDAYAYGCVVMEDVCNDGKVEITGETWAHIYENIKEYFPDGEIVGWFYGGTSFMEEEKEMLTQVHLDHFAGSDRILMLYDFLEKEEEIYRYEESSLVKQSGHYIYYEKNEEMQNYMIYQKQGKNAGEEVDDRVVRQMRARFATQKKESEPAEAPVEMATTQSGKGSRATERFFYGTGIAIAAVAVMMGAAMIYNQERLAGFEQTLNEMLNIAEGGEENAGDGDDSGTVENYVENEANIFEEPLAQETFGNNGVAVNDEPLEGEQNASGGDANLQDLEQQPQISEGAEDVAKPSGNPEVPGNAADVANDKEAGEDKGEGGDQKANDAANSGSGAPDDSEVSGADNIEENESNEESSDSEEADVVGSGLLDTSNYQYYIVQPGDTLVGICMKLYGNLEQMQHIKELNQISNEDLIYAEQELLVP